MSALKWLKQSSKEELLVTLRVQPRASKNAILLPEEDGDALRVRVTSPPVDNAANAALVKLLATVLGLKKSAIQIVSGLRSRRKVVRLDGI